MPQSLASLSTNVNVGLSLPTLPCLGSQNTRSAMTLSLLLKQCPANLKRLCLITSEIFGSLEKSTVLETSSFQLILKVAQSSLVKHPSSFFSKLFVRVQVSHPYSRIASTVALKTLILNCRCRLEFHIRDCLFDAFHANALLVPTSFSVEAIQDPIIINALCCCPPL